jgi:hypothetical protein
VIVPLVFFLSSVALSSLFGINPLRSLNLLISLFFFSATASWYQFSLLYSLDKHLLRYTRYSMPPFQRHSPACLSAKYLSLANWRSRYWSLSESCGACTQPCWDA